jgi:hypothetical protein
MSNTHLPPIASSRGAQGEQRRAESQRRVNVQRDIERMEHVLARLAVQEQRAHRRFEVIESRAREMEGVRKECEIDYAAREKVLMSRIDERVRQQDKVKAVRQERQKRAESARRELLAHKMEMARLTKKQHALVGETLCKQDAVHHDRCVQQHAVIRAAEKDLASARRRTEESRRQAVTASQQQQANDAQAAQERLRLLEKKAEEMRRALQDSKTAENVAAEKLRSLCLTNRIHTGARATSSASGSGAVDNSASPSPSAQKQHGGGGGGASADADDEL